jgi:hypothetical protein
MEKETPEETYTVTRLSYWDDDAWAEVVEAIEDTVASFEYAEFDTDDVEDEEE